MPVFHSSAKFIRWFTLVALLTGLQTQLWALALPQGVSAGPSVGGISEYRLQNGLKVLLFPDASQAKITVNITYLVGSRHENYGQTGQAHLLEHMLFKGSPKFPDVNAEFSKRGAQMNAITRTDITNYFVTLPATEDNLKFAIELEADRMVNAFLKKEDLDKEFTVVRNEFEQGENQPGQVTAKRLFSAAFDWHNYGNLPIGNRGDIENVSIENLRAFYRTYYQPDNATLLIAGKFDAERALLTVSQAFAATPRPTRVLPAINTVEPTQDGEKSVVVRRKGDIQIVFAGYKVPGALHPDSMALTYASLILGHTPSGRLHKKLVETDKIALFGGAETLGYVDPQLVIMTTVQKAGEDVEKLRAALVAVVEDFAKTPPTPEEMARSKQILDNGMEAVLAQPERLGLTLSSYIGLGDWRLFFYNRERLGGVSAAQVQQVAAKYFIRDNRTMATFLPENEPKRAEITAAPKAEAVLAGWTPTTTVVQGEAFEPTAKNIDARTVIKQIGGLKVAMLPKKTRGETVQVRIDFRNGDEKSLMNRSNLFNWSEMMLTLGTTKLSRAALADELQKRQIRGGVTGFETKRNELISAIELVAHVMRDPSFPAEEIEQMRSNSLAGIALSRSDPGTLAQERIAKHFNVYPKGHPYYVDSSEETEAFVRGLKREDLLNVRADLAGASDGLVTIVGDFDVDLVGVALDKAFSAWKSKAPYARLVSQLPSPSAINEWIDVPDKESAVLTARIAFGMSRDDPDYPAMWVADQVMGAGGDLDSRLMKRIRGKEGLSYGVGSSLTVAIRDRVASWRTSGSAAPGAIANMERYIVEEINRAINDGFSADEVARVKTKVRATYDQLYASDTQVASAWLDRMDRGLTFADYEAFIAKVQAVTPEQATAAFRKYVDPAKLSIVKAGDKKKAEAK
jgi:zinc protease